MVLGDLLTEDGPGPEEQFEKTDLRNAVHEVMGKVLSPKEQLVLNHRLGMNGESAKTLAEVGDLMGITRERVRQIESKALRKMKCTSCASGIWTMSRTAMKSKLFGSDWDMAKASGDMPDAFFFVLWKI